MKKINLFIAINFLFICFIKLNAQTLSQTIRGTIVDRESNISLQGANIVVLDIEPTCGTISNTEGKFRIEQIPIGRYDIKISYLGYNDIIIQEILVGSGKEVVLTIGLEESIIDLNEVSVRAFKNKDKPLNSMATVSARSFRVEETRRYAGGLDDPARLASSFAGVSATGIESNAIMVRGNSPSGVLWRLEGMEIPNPSHFSGADMLGGGAITLFSNHMLSSSDFFTGAFPAQYGNALSAVFDINLRTGNNETREHAFQAGVMGIDISSEGPFKQGNQSSYLFNYRYSTLGLLQQFLPEGEGLPVYQDLCFKLNFPAKKAGIFSLWGIGGIDSYEAKADEDTTLWKYYFNREYIDADLITGSAGLNHKYIIGNRTYIKTSAVASVFNNVDNLKWLMEDMQYVTSNKIKSLETKYSFNTTLNHKFSSKFALRTGFIYELISYDYDVSYSPKPPQYLEQIIKNYGNSSFMQAFAQSRFNLSKTIVVNAGLHGQYLLLNEEYSVEPRFGISWNYRTNNTISFAYGLHSQMQPLRVYFIEKEKNGEITQPNKNLDFSKSHHCVLGYDWKINENLRLKIEPYFQYLFDIPVSEDSSFSMVNLERIEGFTEELITEGTGRNIGLDLTFERFLKNGYYYLITASLFDSKYTGGDGIERNTLFNQNYVVNLLYGKEWKIGNNKNNLLGMNSRLFLHGGNRTSPVDNISSAVEEEVIHNETMLYEEQYATNYRFDLTITFRRNKPKYSSVLAVQLFNVFFSPVANRMEYNLFKSEVEEIKARSIFPNISYKIEF